jgi:hypothetical protein
MSQDQIEFKVLFRSPVYPLIVISDDGLMAASNIKELGESCISARLKKGEKVVRAIDTSAEEFWYSPENVVISPGFRFKRWTKKQIVKLYNSSSNARNSGKEYSEKSLSNKKLARVVGEICELLKS